MCLFCDQTFTNYLQIISFPISVIVSVNKIIKNYYVVVIIDVRVNMYEINKKMTLPRTEGIQHWHRLSER